MSQPTADEFIAELSSIINEYEDRSAAAPELVPLIGLSKDMIAALEALKSSLSKRDKPSRAA